MSIGNSVPGFPSEREPSQGSRRRLSDLSSRFREQLPADQHAPDLARAGADLVELGVAQQAAGRVVVDIAVAAEKLDGVERDRGRLLGRKRMAPAASSRVVSPRSQALATA